MRLRVALGGRETPFEAETASRPIRVTLDPGRRLLARIAEP